MRSPNASFWVLDRNGGGKLLVTPENRQLYANSIRYIRLHDEPVPADTQEVLGILDKQYSDGIKREDFTQDQIDLAGEGLKSRRFHREARSAAQTLPDVPPTTATAAPAAQKSPDVVDLAVGAKTVSKKKAAPKKK
jgi:hypothetical protein